MAAEAQLAAAEASKSTHRAIIRANEITVTDPASYEVASSLLSNIKTAQKLVRDKKDLVLKPLNEALREYRGMFKGPEDEITKAESIVKGKMLTYAREAREKEARLQARVDRGTMKPETAMRKMDDVAVVNTEDTQLKQSARKVRVVDATLLNPKYLNNPRVLDLLAILVKGEALEQDDRKLKMKGVEVYRDDVISAR